MTPVMFMDAGLITPFLHLFYTVKKENEFMSAEMVVYGMALLVTGFCGVLMWGSRKSH